MPTIFSHPAAALAFRAVARAVPTSVLVAGIIGSVLPDLDVIAFPLGIPYAHPLGHRGFSHSLLFAALAAAVMTFVLKRSASARDGSSSLIFTYTFACIASHGVLDALTTGGRGVGFLIPFSNERFFFPVRPIRVSPIGVGGFLERGAPVLISELTWLWLPAVVVMVMAALVRRRRDADGGAK